MATFLASGSDVLRAPNINVLSNAGQDSAGQITVTGGSKIFSDQSIVEFTVDPVSPDGEMTTSSGFTQIVVFASEADYLAGTPTYTYTPQNPGQKAGIQDSIDRIGDDYIRFGAQVLTSSDPGAPALQELFVAPGSDVANQGSMTFDHHTDQDFDNSGSIDAGSGEEGDGFFNINSAQASGAPACFTSGSYVQTPNGLVLIDTVQQGDMISTLDNGPQPVLWISKRRYGPAQLVMHPQHRPVLIKRNTWGATHDTLVSQQHCVLACPDLLVPAKKLIGVRHSRARIARGIWRITYIHLFFQSHQLIQVNGIPAESLYPGPQCLRQFDAKQHAALIAVFPELNMHDPGSVIRNVYGPTVRPIARNQHNLPVMGPRDFARTF